MSLELQLEISCPAKTRCDPLRVVPQCPRKTRPIRARGLQSLPATKLQTAHPPRSAVSKAQEVSDVSISSPSAASSGHCPGHQTPGTSSRKPQLNLVQLVPRSPPQPQSLKWCQTKKSTQSQACTNCPAVQRHPCDARAAPLERLAIFAMEDVLDF